MAELVRRRAWMVYLAAGVVATLLYLTAAPLKGNTFVMFALGLSPVIAIPCAIRLHQPEAKAPWYWFAGGFLLFWLGDLYTYSYPKLTGNETPFPSLGDGAYIAVYPALMVGLLLVVRRRAARSTDRGAIDAAILTIGLAVPSWIALIAPYLHDHELGTAAKLVSVAYPLGDVLLLAAALRLALDGGKRGTSFHLMSSAIVLLLVTDFAYGLMTLHGTYAGQLWLDAGWVGFYVLWGAAALHPSMRILDHGRPARSALTPRPPRAAGHRVADRADGRADPRHPARRHRHGGRHQRGDHPLRPGRGPDGRPHAQPGALDRARARAEPRGCRARRGGHARGA